LNPAPAPTEAPFAQAGRAELEVHRVSGESAAVSAFAAAPLKLLVPRPRGASVWAYLSSYGGGLVAGDETAVTVKLGAETRCFLSTQAATKVYRNPAGLPCGQRLAASVGPGAILVAAPDPVQAFAGSAYVQRQEFELAPGSGLALVDSVCCGRAARGERWAFNRFHSRNSVSLEGRRLFFDSLLLDPADGALAGTRRLGRVDCLALVLILGEPFRAAAARLLEEIAALPVSRRESLVRAASPVADGILLRLAGEHPEEVAREIHRRLAFLAGFLHDDPWSRKW
jgi:urease accessory protein